MCIRTALVATFTCTISKVVSRLPLCRVVQRARDFVAFFSLLFLKLRRYNDACVFATTRRSLVAFLRDGEKYASRVRSAVGTFANVICLEEVKSVTSLWRGPQRFQSEAFSFAVACSSTFELLNGVLGVHLA